MPSPTSQQDKLDALLQMTRTLGEPHREYVIIGEGNTSCRIDADAFYIKASGQQMVNIGAEGFVAVQFAPVLALLDDPPATYSEAKRISNDARVDRSVSVVPSVEVSFHAMLLHECDAQIIGHTHPIAVNRLLCSNHAEAFAKNRTCPDEVVLCGPESVFVPYVDPGLPLAIIMRDKVRAYMAAYDEAPKVILLANHGMIAIGQTPTEVLNITAMCVKAAHILMGAYAVGEPVFLPREEILHIYKRPDEIYRRNQFV
ncbi:class II aldolase/adducin family protein [Phototrophicus methaneseepsis]|uniref:Class II aldolase/adducin family protein n=1 Tax=Phototrophicus methaneseepsis TaxID=2710758 RepID=A0A7S8EC55_9CHLR|nr:class II aldolase/adducin family protein [Phototrophicus methaneseepsis]QPC84242.1 class II aldolase/adducin family protein [Phototrophicus methaneseepsis]